jgi:hypothetical protein
VSKKKMRIILLEKGLKPLALSKLGFKAHPYTLQHAAGYAYGRLECVRWSELLWGDCHNHSTDLMGLGRGDILAVEMVFRI